ncbi:malonate decarboxylase subunit epsilon [Acinetobacter sp. ANC 4654]|uniref:malonate decarboxylase subunit epsilon n=1 Tax=Acinetobacter sp. ANC 4654 TaxID=1977872 RepID=UPI000A33C220|nr:malonate decarboxylase subunit epsilon [Acinetobacter sp. ANC 4654]OTG92673.1 malonate decarboxylase subunit epsilon [Acinetobacter sp. ANC 4654]
MSSIWVYPGQGAQKVNMLRDLPQTTLVQHYLEQATDILKQDVLLLDQPEALKSTYAVQLCLFISGVISSCLMSEQGVKPDYVAGLSIGAWAAATVAGVLSFEDGLKLVALRGRLMQQAYPSGYGMTALIGTNQSDVEIWVNQVYQQNQDVFIANLNTANQIVISGSNQAMKQVAEKAQENGVLAKRLEVSVPSHCSLLDVQAKQLAEHIKGVVQQQPNIRYLSGTSARLLMKKEQVIEDISFNMCRMIDWESTVQSAWERGVRLQIESLPGTVLTGLARQTFKEGTVLSFQGTRLDSLIGAMHKESARSLNA